MGNREITYSVRFCRKVHSPSIIRLILWRAQRRNRGKTKEIVRMVGELAADLVVIVPGRFLWVNDPRQPSAELLGQAMAETGQM
jgi:hypothetical protein